MVGEAPGQMESSEKRLYQLRGVEKGYNGRKVLDVNALDIVNGEILGIVGPSGAGKSTLLRILAFLEAPTSGRILFDGRPCEGDWPTLEVQRTVTMLFQDPYLLRRSVYDNVVYGLGLRGHKNNGYAVASAIEQLGLSGLAHARAHTLSGGEAQRVALARSLVLEPEVLLLDEPTSNLDPANIKLIEEMIRSVNRERGMTVIMVTHNIFQARRLADRVGLLLAGKLIEVSPTPVFFDHPRHPETAAFVGGDLIY